MKSFLPSFACEKLSNGVTRYTIFFSELSRWGSAFRAYLPSLYPCQFMERCIFTFSPSFLRKLFGPFLPIMEGTQSLAGMDSIAASHGTQSDWSFRFMDSEVFQLALNQYKVLYAVVVAFAVYVVNYLVSPKYPPKMIRHDNPVLQNIAMLGCHWVSSFKQNDVTSRGLDPALEVIQRIRILTQPSSPTCPAPFSIFVSRCKVLTAVLTDCSHRTCRIRNLAYHSNA